MSNFFSLAKIQNFQVDIFNSMPKRSPFPFIDETKLGNFFFIFLSSPFRKVPLL